MKKILSLILCVAFVQIANAGEFEKKVDHFTTVTAIGNYKVTLIQSDEEKVVVENSDAELEDEKILVTVKGSELKIKIKNDIFKERNMHITVYYKKVTEINSKKGCILVVDDVLKGDVFKFNSGNGGKIRVHVECETALLSITSGGSVNISGKAELCEYKITTGGTIDAVTVDVKTVTAKVSAGGDIRCNATDKLTISISTGGNVSYKYSGEESNYSEKITLGGNIKKIKS